MVKEILWTLDRRFFLKNIYRNTKRWLSCLFETNVWCLFHAEKERELGHAYSEIKRLKVTEALKDKAIAEVIFST